jgi:predicted nucleotidyltransferase
MRPRAHFDRDNTEYLADLIRRIREVSSPLRIVLFGSAARNQNGPDSDLDVLIVISGSENSRSVTRAVYRNLIGFTLPVDVVVATEDDLALYGDNPSLVYYPALREGKVIYAS